MSEKKQRLHLIIKGKVQGVFFRASTVEEANRIGGLSGFVRNLPDESVEIVAEGLEENLKKLLSWAHHGPARSKVESVEINWEPAQGQWSDFHVAR